MTDKEKRELKDSIINIFKRFNILGNTASIGELRNNILRCVDSMQEEPVSEDLEEAVDEYAPDFSNSIASKAAVDAIRDAFKAGAQWQKQQDQSTIELAEDHAMLAGMNKMEQQMMVKAVDGIARPYDNEIWCILDSFNLEDGDEVKVIVIKKK